MDALLCVYPFNSQEEPGTYRLGHETPVPADGLEPLPEHLNSLDGVDASAERGCTLMAHDQYQIVLNYPDDTHVLVRIDYNCGTASSTGAVRQIRSMDSVLGFWPDR